VFACKKKIGNAQLPFNDRLGRLAEEAVGELLFIYVCIMVLEAASRLDITRCRERLSEFYCSQVIMLI
jgi:hypothetical protein